MQGSKCYISVASVFTYSKAEIMTKSTIKIIVGSKNPVKVNAVKTAFISVFPNNTIDCQGVNAPSLVADQPMTEQETLTGAENRVNYCQQQHQADYYVAVEGGVDNFKYGPATFAYIVITNNKNTSTGRSTNLPLPEVVYQALVAGKELGDVMDELFNTVNIKQKGGAMGLLTNGLATRESIYNQALILALSPFVFKQLYHK